MHFMCHRLYCPIRLQRAYYRGFSDLLTSRIFMSRDFSHPIMEFSNENVKYLGTSDSDLTFSQNKTTNKVNNKVSQVFLTTCDEEDTFSIYLIQFYKYIHNYM